MESGTVWSEMTGTVWSEMGGTVWSVIAIGVNKSPSSIYQKVETKNSKTTNQGVEKVSTISESYGFFWKVSRLTGGRRIKSRST